VNTRLLREVIEAIVISIFGQRKCTLSVALLSAEEISRINKTFLKHDGATDVITFDYSDGSLCGEILVCVDEAISQAHAFGTTWQSELVRYLIHGLLHLEGYHDHVAAARRKMKRKENRILKQLGHRFDLSKL